MKVLQINTTVNSGSTGRIAEEIGHLLIQEGHESFIGYGRGINRSKSALLKIGDKWDQGIHGLESRIFDNHGFASKSATINFIKAIEQINPDIIHLHNIHGYYLNIEVLFNYLRKSNKPVVWTLHDCWSFTGHCSFFNYANCFRWKTGCYSCPNKKEYPASWIIDNSKNNYLKKKELFTSLSSLTFVTPSIWLSDYLKDSYFKNYPVKVINNGVNISVFNSQKNTGTIKAQYNIPAKKIILGVASLWNKRKGLEDFIQLSKLISDKEVIVLVGLEKNLIENLPSNIIGIARTEDVGELAALYTAADVFVNPTYVDNFPTTNIEALACGTPVITYNTGGSPEAIDERTGLVVDKGDIGMLHEKVQFILNKGKKFYANECRSRAQKYFNKDDRYMDYVSLYKTILNTGND